MAQLRIINFFKERVWSAIPSDVSTRNRRIAALAWPAFLVLLGGLIAWHRHGEGLDAVGRGPLICWVLAPLLAALLLVHEATGRATYLFVMRAFGTVGFFVSHLLLILFFYLVVTPLSVLLRLMGKDLLKTRRGETPAWTNHHGYPDRRRFYRLF